MEYCVVVLYLAMGLIIPRRDGRTQPQRLFVPDTPDRQEHVLP